MLHFARIAYNSGGWRVPTGDAAKLETNSFCSVNGFGYEEWLFRSEWEIDGWRYAFLQGVNASYKKLTEADEPIDVVVFTRDPEKGVKLVARIDNVECLSSTEAQHALATFKKNGWFDQMKAEVDGVSGNTNNLESTPNATGIFNIRYRPTSLKFFPPDTLAGANDPIQGWSRYQLIARTPTIVPLNLPGEAGINNSSGNFFWVNLGRSYKEVKEHSFLWAPAFGHKKDGSVVTNAGWDALQDIKRGDVIFCHRKGEIIDVAVATADAQPAERPKNRTFDSWKNDGFRVEVKLRELATPVDVALFKDTLIAVHNESCKPALFDRNGGTAQVYMVRLPKGAGGLIMSHLGDAELLVSDDVQEQKPKGRARVSKGGNREVIAQARIGQGQFRTDLLSLWKGKCAITGLAKHELLIASHIVPWSLSNETEKIDKHNGLLLSPAIDKLFDKGYVSFGDDGAIIVQEALIDNNDLQLLGISPKTTISKLNVHQRDYLKRHRQLYHFDKDK